MPIYEFRCQDCHRRFEILCRMGEDGSTLSCPDCAGKRLQRCMSTFAAFSRDVGGSSKSLGPSGCSSCTSSSCRSCGG